VRRAPGPATAAALVAACAVVPFARVLFRGEVLFERDIQALRWGQLESFARCVRSGSLPLWDTLAGLGQPMLADPGTQALYPFTWLSVLFSPPAFYDLYAFAHVLVAGAGAFVLARRLELSTHAGALVGALYLLSGPLLSTVSLWQHLAGAALLPWVLAAADAALERPGVLRALAWGTAVALQLLAGSLDYVALGVLAQAIFAWRHIGPRGDARRRRVATAAGAAAFAVLLSAAQWVPALALLRGSPRAALGADARLAWSTHPALLAQALVPLFPQDLPLASAVRQELYDGREPLFSSLYLGLAALPLVVAGLSARPRRTPALLAVLAATAALLALGRHAHVYSWAVQAVPSLALFRYPVKATVPLALAWAVLAGFGLDAWPTASRRRRALAIAAAFAGVAVLLALLLGGPAVAVRCLDPEDSASGLTARLAAVLAALGPAALLAAIAAALFALAPRGRATAATGAAVLAAVADVALAHAELLPSIDARRFAEAPPLVAAARGDGVVRLQFVDYMRRRSGHTGGDWPKDSPAYLTLPWSWRGAVRAVEYPVNAARWGVRGGLVEDVAGLESTARRSLALLLQYYQEEAEPLARLLRISAVTHLASRHRDGLEPFPLRAKVRAPYLGATYLQRVPDPLPRAYAVEGVRVASGPAAYPVLLDPAFDPAREVVLPEGQERPATGGFVSEVRVVDERPGHISLDVRANRAALVVVVEGHSPDWRARVDGRPVPVQAANALAIAVPVGVGAQHVALDYHPPIVALGLALSGLAAAAALALVAGSRVRAAGRGGTPP
jgi:hypothetical protein